MEIIINAQQLRDALRKVSTSVARSVNMQALNSVKIVATDDTVTITSSNINVTTVATVDASIGTAGEAVLPFVQLKHIADTATEEVTITTNGNTANITGYGKYTIPLLSASEFPLLPTIDSEGITVNNSEMQKAIATIKYAAGSHDYKYTLDSIFLDTENIVATNGTRLAYIPFALPHKLQEGMLLSSKAIPSIFEVDGEEITVRHNNSVAMFQGETITVYALLMVGNFPNYKKVVPDYTGYVSFNKQKLLSTVRAVNINKTSAMILLQCSDDKAQIKMSKDGVTAEAVIDAEVDAPLTCHLSSDYLIDALNAIESEEVTIKHEGREGLTLLPLLLTGDGSFHIIMPMRSN